MIDESQTKTPQAEAPRADDQTPERRAANEHHRHRPQVGTTAGNCGSTTKPPTQVATLDKAAQQVATATTPKTPTPTTATGPSPSSPTSATSATRSPTPRRHRSGHPRHGLCSRSSRTAARHLREAGYSVTGPAAILGVSRGHASPNRPVLIGGPHARGQDHHRRRHDRRGRHRLLPHGHARLGVRLPAADTKARLDWARRGGVWAPRSTCAPSSTGTWP